MTFFDEDFIPEEDLGGEEVLADGEEERLDEEDPFDDGEELKELRF